MSRQFDVFAHPTPSMRGAYPHIIILQHDSFESVGSVVVAPLVAPLRMPLTRGYPLLALQGVSVMLLTPNLATIARSRLDAPPLTNLEDQREQIVAALDLLFVGS